MDGQQNSSGNQDADDRQKRRTAVAGQRMKWRAVWAGLFSALGLAPIAFTSIGQWMPATVMVTIFAVAAVFLVLFFDAHENWQKIRE